VSTKPPEYSRPIVANSAVTDIANTTSTWPALGRHAIPSEICYRSTAAQAMIEFALAIMPVHAVAAGHLRHGARVPVVYRADEFGREASPLRSGALRGEQLETASVQAAATWLSVSTTAQLSLTVVPSAR